MLVINLLSDDTQEKQDKNFTIEVPEITHDEAQGSADVVTFIQNKYGISDEDIDHLYNAFVTVFVRGKQLNKN